MPLVNTQFCHNDREPSESSRPQGSSSPRLLVKPWQGGSQGLLGDAVAVRTRACVGQAKFSELSRGRFGRGIVERRSVSGRWCWWRRIPGSGGWGGRAPHPRQTAANPDGLVPLRGVAGTPGRGAQPGQTFSPRGIARLSRLSPVFQRSEPSAVGRKSVAHYSRTLA